MNINTWPELSYDEAKGTYETVHLWTQIAGKIKLGKLPWVNHSWHVTLFVTPYGLTTGDIPDKDKHFQINFDFLNHRLVPALEVESDTWYQNKSAFYQLVNLQVLTDLFLSVV